MPTDPIQREQPTPRAGGSYWEKLKPVWWLRGILGAGALVGLADHLGLVRENWLRLFHAIGSRWNEWMGWLTGWISAALPFGWNISSGEGSTFALFSTLLVPAMIPAARTLLMRPRQNIHVWAVAAFFGVGFVLTLQMLGPVDMVPESASGYTPWFAIGFTGLVAVALLWIFQRRYLKALLIGLTFLLTLEIFYLVPAIQTALDPIIDQIAANKPTPQ